MMIKQKLGMLKPIDMNETYESFTVEEINRILTVIDFLNDMDNDSCVSFRLEMISVDRIEVTKGNFCLMDLEAWMEDDKELLTSYETIYNTIVDKYKEHVDHVVDVMELMSGNHISNIRIIGD
jgi:hypothetical protein